MQCVMHSNRLIIKLMLNRNNSDGKIPDRKLGKRGGMI